MTTTTTPAAAAVEKIVRECAENILHDYHKEVWQNEQTYDHMRLTPNLERHLHRAVREAISALQVREALEKLGKRSHYYCEDSYYSCPLATDGCADSNVPADECNCGAGEHNEQLRQALANLDAVCGKEMK